MRGMKTRKLPAFIGLAVISGMPLCAPPLHAQWFVDGRAVCEAEGDQHDPSVAGDGMGGVLIAWSDQRGMTVERDIYAQRLAPDGSPLWTVDGVRVCSVSGTQERPRIAPDGTGGAIILWTDMRSGSDLAQLYAQRVDSAGTVKWTSGGVLVSGIVWSQEAPGFTGDGEGGIIVSWSEERPETGFDVFVQRMSRDGVKLWASNGIIVCGAAGEQFSTSVCSDGNGGAIVAWGDWRETGSTFEARSQRIDAQGDALWQENGVVAQASDPDNYYYWTVIAPDGAGGAVLAWRRMTYDPEAPQGEREIFKIEAQRIDSGGDILWHAHGVFVDEDPISLTIPDLTIPVIEGDGDGGVTLAWEKSRTDTVQVYMQKIDGGGDAVFAAGGVPVCAESDDQHMPSVADDGSGGVIIVWADGRHSSSYDIYGQRFSDGGFVQWHESGIPICAAGNLQDYPSVARVAPGYMAIAWRDRRSVYETDIFAGKVSSEGQVVANLLLSSFVALERGVPVVRWELSESRDASDFEIGRSAGTSGAFSRLGKPDMEADGTSFVFSDGECLPGETYRYRVWLMEDGNAGDLLFETGPVSLPAARLELAQNRPNPFNPSTGIEFYLPSAAKTTIEIFDVGGRLVRGLLNETRPAGRQTVRWDGFDDGGNAMASGVYLYRLRAGKQSMTRKMVLLK